LLLMEKSTTNQSFLQHQELEIRRMQFSINFEDKDKQDISYKHYAKHIQELDDIRNTTITKGLTEAIDYLKVKSEKEYLNNENKYLDTQMNIDELTKVFTRHYLDVLMEKYTKINFNSVGFIMFDLDCLKEYNDTYGHVDGDYVLHYIGSLLNLYKREGIHPCRFGGDEFVCLCINCTDDQIENYVKEIRKDLHDRHLPHLTSSCAKEVTLSIGYCNTQNNKNMNKIFELADQALYQAKQKGRNTYCKLLG
jgi:diguanylate cyclase (GGDEF)-like protein